MLKNKIKEIAYNLSLICIGCFLIGFAVNAFIIPNQFISSGITGATIMIHYLNPHISLGNIYLLVNIPIFILGFFFVGKRFIAYSICGVLIYSASISNFQISLDIQDKLLCAVMGGGTIGVAIAIILRSYGSTGGSDILCVVANKLFGIQLGTVSLFINIIVMSCALFYFPIQDVLYAIVCVFSSTIATNLTFKAFNQRRAAIIVSSNWKEIMQELSIKHKVGITILHGNGGYKGDEKTILYTVFNKNKSLAVKKAIIKKDKMAFMAIMEASDVTGVEIGNQPHW